MKNVISTILLTILFSLFYFPVEFYVLPGVNSKMVIAVCGLATLVMNRLISKDKLVSHLFFGVVSISLIFSLISYISVVYNNTNDLVYATYIIKMSVWLAGAYFVVSVIKWIHGRISFQLLFHYLAIVCVMHCVLALLIDNIPSLENWVMNTFVDKYEFIKRNDRLYSIGASFDTAGVRFTTALIGLIYLMMNKRSNSSFILHMMMWAVIVVVGSAMSRTTSIGAIVSLVYLLFSKMTFGWIVTYKTMKLLVGISLFVCLGLFIVFYCYYNIPAFKDYMEFGFQNFFNYGRSGEFTSNSTRNLMNMFILPDNFKTWIIGDAIFDIQGGFYMSTDIGYLRFIFYCGIIGLISFISLFVFMTIELCKKWPQLKGLFVILLLWQFLVWIKISTDIFLTFALLALVPVMGDKIGPIFNKNKGDLSYDS